MPEFRNPNAGGSAGAGRQDNSSFLTMLFVMMAVLFGMQYWRARHTPPAESPAAPVAAPAATRPAVNNSVATTAPAAATAVTTPAVQAASQTSIVVENELYRITFSNRGGDVTSWILKRYKDNDGHPLDLVHQGAAALYGYPLSLYTYDGNLTRALSEALYVPSATGTLQSPAKLSFQYQANGLQVTKTFTFGSDYVIHADTQVLQNGVPVAAALAWPAGFGDEEDAAGYNYATIDTMTNGSVHHDSFKKVVGGATLNGPFDWASVADQYFGTAFLPDHPANATLITLSQRIDSNKVGARIGQGSTAKGTAMVPVLGAAMGDRTNHVQVRVFVGPKAMPVLNAIKSTTGYSLESMVDFGFFGAIGKPLFIALEWVHAHITASWGWAIILFTGAIYVVLLPLRVSSMRSAIKLQRIQPQIDAIKKKFGSPGPTDPKAGEMNQEIMAFQKQNGVNPMGGCIPSLIQLPLLYAFFTMMTRVVELRQAHFMWLPDLSAPDPYHILPILMVLTSFAVQFMMPTPGVDPQQQRMMAFMMPAFSGWLTWKYASGLALYWNVGNVIMIIQQYAMNQTALGREMRELQLKRAKAKAAASGGGGRILQGRR